ncbi:flagellar assembly protein FliH [Pantoea dispersa]|uniref:flagellar assembly protein FliH n=1 Tax=Pantoea dispersa TaxID=59814 RepID=UPI001CA6DC52|nr:flagellar assembly protein FliH [Pantoea dispersa]QZY96448.1 flagellar assembly protein FliH [Pantoea dispersa]
MPTSDRATWTRWQPDNLLADLTPESVSAPLQPPADAPAAEHLEAELRQLRQQAQQQGLSDGQRRGREEGHAQGYEAGFHEGQQAGYAQGLAKAQADLQVQGEQARALLASFQATLEQINKLIPARLLQHALAAARQIVGDSLVANPALLSDQLRRYLQEDRWLQQDAVLAIHPQDLPWVQEYLAASCQALRWEIRTDDSILPGGCRLTWAEGELDATLERRWQALCQLSREDLVP